MKSNYPFKTGLLLVCLCLLTLISYAQVKVVGYMPSWAGSASAIQYTKLTHINYAFIRPTTTGGLTAVDNGAKLSDIVSRAHAVGVKVGIAVGGWSDLQNQDFQSMAGNSTYRTNFVNNLINLCNQYGLDGVDIDWEYPSSGADPANFNTLMGQLASALHSRGKYLSAAVAAYGSNADGIQSGVFSSVDFLNLMAYDGPLPNHSTYDYAVQTLNYWKGRGLPASKAVLGVPFYGRSSSEYVNYNAILQRGGSPDSDYFGSIGYNGRPTIRSKTSLGIQNGGIMIWDLSGDEGTGANSLLTAIDGVVKGSQPTTCSGAGTSVPATIQAESFCQMSGIQTETTTDAGGGQNVGWIDAGDWMAYRISVATAGTYTVQYRVASQAGGGSIRLEALGGSTVFGTITVPSTGGWQTWTTIQHNISLPAGQQTIALAAPAGGFNLNWIAINPTGTQSFSTTIQAENYSAMSGIQTETCSEGGLNVGWFDAGDWLAYNSVNIPTAGTYRVIYRVASPNASRTLRLEKDAGATQLGTVTIPTTGGWQNWANVAHNVTLPAGTYTLGIASATGGFNINYFTITSNLSARLGTDGTLITDEEDVKSILSPNPVQDQLFIKDHENVKYIKIYNIHGQEMLSVERPGSSISVQSLKAGVHIAVIQKLDASLIKGKLVKH